MKKTFTAATLFFYAQLCIAMGWGELTGTNEKGDLLSVYPAWVEGDQLGYSDGDLYFVLYYKGGLNKSGAPASKPIKYKYQRCKFKSREIDSVRIEFSCEESGKSPLSGVTYKVIQNNDPNDCSYVEKFICTHGCADSVVPKMMLHAPEGCFE